MFLYSFFYSAVVVVFFMDLVILAGYKFVLMGHIDNSVFGLAAFKKIGLDLAHHIEALRCSNPVVPP